MMDIPRVKPWPTDAVQCNDCGGRGCETCEKRGWLTKGHVRGRYCHRDVCSKPIPPDQVAIYCSNDCACRDAWSGDKAFHFSLNVEFRAADKPLAEAAARDIVRFIEDNVFVVNVDVADPVTEVDEEGNRV